MKIAFFDAKPYDKTSFDKYSEEMGVCIKYFYIPRLRGRLLLQFS